VFQDVAHQNQVEPVRLLFNDETYNAVNQFDIQPFLPTYRHCFLGNIDTLIPRESCVGEGAEHFPRAATDVEYRSWDAGSTRFRYSGTTAFASLVVSTERFSKYRWYSSSMSSTGNQVTKNFVNAEPNL
jgi:hypothetical protein